MDNNPLMKQMADSIERTWKADPETEPQSGSRSFDQVVGCLTSPRDYSVFMANAILTAGGKASTAFTIAVLFAEDLERREAANVGDEPLRRKGE